MNKSVHIDKRALIDRINEIDDVKVLEKLRKILFAAKVREPEPCTFSNEQVKEILDKQRQEKKTRLSNSQVMDIVARW